MTGPVAAVPDDLGFKLSHALTAWVRANTHLRIRCVVPIQRDGCTVELHAWYDQVQFRDSSPLAPPRPEEG
jgi:hypothetical protein